MAEQRLHSSLGPIDVLTQLELEQSLHRGLDSMIRERYRGVDLIRFPRVTFQATGTTVNLFASPNEAPAGPSSGDFWLVRRLIVKSNVLTDTAKYVVYRGSSPSDVANAYGPVNLLDTFTGGATPGLNVNVGFYPGTKSIGLEPGEQIYAALTAATVGNIYVLDGEGIRVPAEMKGKIL